MEEVDFELIFVDAVRDVFDGGFLFVGEFVLFGVYFFRMG